MVLIRPEFIASTAGGLFKDTITDRIEQLSKPFLLDDRDLSKTSESILKIQKDTSLSAPLSDVHDLIRHELYALLLRLYILSSIHSLEPSLSKPSKLRFSDFKRLLEKNYCKWHHVAPYATELGCSEKTLTRVTLDAAGVSAKAFIAARIVLEAKRILVHTSLSVCTISETLGFDEPTNFGKFFKREVGFTPANFRKQRNHFT